MPEGRYFLKMGGIFILGLISLVIGFIVFFLALPFLIVLGLAALFLVLAFVVIWVIIYVILLIGAAIWYAIKKPMKVEKKGSYEVEKTKEAGKREKGKS